MSTQPPLAYESRAGSIALPLWNILRWGLILWSATILVRHGSYWLLLVVGGGSRSLTAMALAGVESLVLLAILIVGLCTSRTTPTARTLVSIGALSLAYLAIQLVTFGVELFTTSAAPTRVVWMLASRVQVWIVPLMAIAAARKSR